MAFYEVVGCFSCCVCLWDFNVFVLPKYGRITYVGVYVLKM